MSAHSTYIQVRTCIKSTVFCINNIHKDIISTEELKMMRIHYIHTIAIMILTTCSFSSMY